MTQIDKEVERQKSNIEENKDTIEKNILPRAEDYDEDSSCSYMSMYRLDSSEEGSKSLSNWTPTVVVHNASLPMHVEEVHSSPITKKVMYELRSVVQE